MNEENNTEEEIFIYCLGVDDKIHVCQPHLDVCACGMKVKRKKLDDPDQGRFSCYECTY